MVAGVPHRGLRDERGCRAGLRAGDPRALARGVRKRDKYVWAAIFNLTWYCIVSLVLTANDKTVPDSLTVAWFAAWTAELALLANIKIKGKDD